jgi:hypothetical protein
MLMAENEREVKMVLVTIVAGNECENGSEKSDLEMAMLTSNRNEKRESIKVVTMSSRVERAKKRPQVPWLCVFFNFCAWYIIY